MEHPGGALVGQQLILSLYTAKADPLGPYCTGASIPAGNVLRCARSQAQVPLTMRYSMTSRWITTSTAWRRSASTVVAISDLGAAAPARTGPRQRDDHALIGVIDQGSR